MLTANNLTLRVHIIAALGYLNTSEYLASEGEIKTDAYDKQGLAFETAFLALLPQRDPKICHENTADALLCGSRSVTQLLYQSSILWLWKQISCNCIEAQQCSFSSLSPSALNVTSEHVGRLTIKTDDGWELHLHLFSLLSYTSVENCQYFQQVVNMICHSKAIYLYFSHNWEHKVCAIWTKFHVNRSCGAP